MTRSPLPASLSRFSLVAAMAFGLVGCDDGSTSPTSYRPFDAANVEEPVAWVAAHDEIKTLAGQAAEPGADIHTLYDQIQSLYVSTGLQTEIVERADEHPYVANGAGFGAYVDQQLTRAITLAHAASGATASRDLTYVKNVLDKLTQVFFHVGIWHELGERSRVGVDEAFAFYGLPYGGTAERALAASALKRETSFGITINATVADAFLDARAAVLDGEPSKGGVVPTPFAAYDDARDAIDREGLRIFAYGLRTYLEKLRDSPTSSPDVALLEGRCFWFGLERFAAGHDAATAAAGAALDGYLYPAGKPDASAPGVHVLSGLEEVRTGSRVIDAVAALAELQIILDAIEG